MTKTLLARALVPALAAALLAGCAATDTTAPPALSETQARFDSLRNNRQVATLAPVPLFEAEKYLRQAEMAEAKGNDRDRRHFTYMAEQQMGIAEATARERQAVAQRERLTEQSTQARLRAREQRVAELEQQLDARLTDRGTVLTLQDVLFESGEATLRPGAINRLQPLAEYLVRTPGQQVVIEGHTDSVGPAEFNEDLSQRRAEAVKSVLISQGVPADRILARGLGENFPRTTNETLAGRQANRRVEVLLSEVPEDTE